MNDDIQFLEKMLTRLTHAEPETKAKAQLLEDAYRGIKAAIAALDAYQGE